MLYLERWEVDLCMPSVSNNSCYWVSAVSWNSYRTLVSFVLSWKLASRLLHVYSTHPGFERSNYCQNCAYYTPDFTVNVFRQSIVDQHLLIASRRLPVGHLCIVMLIMECYSITDHSHAWPLHCNQWQQVAITIVALVTFGRWALGVSFGEKPKVYCCISTVIVTI